ncbi:MAG: recombinase family protein [Mariniphaga sp.]|nr:recombinase family protein [Mariniphaga sp.]
MKAVIYTRVSTEEQRTDRQGEELMQYANNNEIEVLELFEDKITGKSKQEKRREFSAMLSYIELNEVKLILCYEVSRLGRNLLNALNTIQDLKEQGINIFLLKENSFTISNNPSNQLNLNILFSIAEFQREMIKSNTISGMQSSIRKGGSGSSDIKQYGYKRENKKLVIDEFEAEIIRDIFKKYLSGYSIIEIKNYLNENNIPSKYMRLKESGIIRKNLSESYEWSTASICRLLKAKLLTGYRVYGSVELQDEAFRIIDNITFSAVANRLANKRDREPNAQKYENIFKGVLICGHCGGAMYMQKGTSKKTNHYKCFNRFIKKTCQPARNINIDLLNNLVYSITKDFKVDSKEVKKKLNENIEFIEKNNSGLIQIEKEIVKNITANEKLTDLYLSERINIISFDKRVFMIKEELSSLNDRKDSLLKINEKLAEESNILNSKKLVNLFEPVIFKENIKSLVKYIKVSCLNEELITYENLLFNSILPTPLKILNGKDILYKIDVIMFDGTHNFIYSNCWKNDVPKIITVGRK